MRHAELYLDTVCENKTVIVNNRIATALSETMSRKF